MINIEQINNYYKKILILDFDLTITDIHTCGRINNNFLYWYSIENLNMLIKTLSKFKNLNWLIYIVSRGITTDIKNYLTKFNISNIFDDIYGAIDYAHLSESTFIWSKYKKIFIDNIMELNKVEKRHIFYIDDTEENISYAKSHDYHNSILLPSIGVSSILLVGILEKILIDND
jgi:hypothetical protein